jgi:hypothetical protein
MVKPTFSVPFGTAVTYVGIWLKLVPSFSNPSPITEVRNVPSCVWVIRGTHASGE